MEFFFKIVLIISLIFLILMKHPGRVQEYAKKNLKSIDFMRQKLDLKIYSINFIDLIKKKTLKYSIMLVGILIM